MDTRLKSTIRGVLFGLLGVATVALATGAFTLYQPANGVQCNTGATYINTACTGSVLPAPGSTTQVVYNLGGVLAANAQATVAADLGLVVGAATGGSKGPGTLNATALYVNGSPVGISGGAVSSVGLALPSSVFIVTGTPVTSAGTLTGAFQTQTANTIWAGPASGGAATPTFRTTVIADIPTIPAAHTSGFATVATSGAYSDLSGTPSIPVGANPSASAGPTAVNGSATTFMRSDAAPAINLSANYVWTGTQQSTGTPVLAGTTSGFSAGTQAGGGIAYWANSAGGTDSKVWRVYATTTTFEFGAINDANSSEGLWLGATRSGTAITGVVIGNPTNSPPITLDGPVSVPAFGTNISIVAHGPATNWTMQDIASTSTGQSFGHLIFAGTNTSDTAVAVLNAAGSTTYFNIRGDGAVTVGSPTGGSLGLGTLNAQALYVNGNAVPSGVGHMLFAKISGSAGGCSVTNSSGLANTTCMRTGVGTYSITPTGFSNNSACGAVGDSGGSIRMIIASASAAGVAITTLNASNATVDDNFSIECSSN